MADEEKILDQLVSFGLSIDEINELSIADAILYIRFHHEKRRAMSSILFVGFSDDETINLSDIAKESNLTIKSQVSNDLTFLCFSGNDNNKRVEKAKGYGTKILNKDEFKRFFFKTEYTLQENKFIYDLTVPVDFRIAKPLSNFDKNIEVESFSLNSTETYTVNLNRMSCNCIDFRRNQREQYPIGDIRRMCRHIMREYWNKFGLMGLSKLNSYLIENSFSLKKYFRKIVLEKIDAQVVLNFESSQDWWDIFIPNEKGVYTKYGYSPLEERFSYDDKPYGFVTPLRVKLKEIKKELDRDKNMILEANYVEIYKQKSSIVYLIIMAVLIICFILYLVF